MPAGRLLGGLSRATSDRQTLQPEAGKRRALIGMVKAHPASVKVILLLFSDRENLLLLTLDGHRLHGKQAQPLCFARDAPRFSHRVQLGLACFACYAGGAVVRKFASSSYESWTSQRGGQCGQIVDFQMCVLTLWA